MKVSMKKRPESSPRHRYNDSVILAVAVGVLRFCDPSLLTIITDVRDFVMNVQPLQFR